MIKTRRVNLTGKPKTGRVGGNKKLKIMAILTKERLTNVTEITLGSRLFRQTLFEAKQETKINSEVTVFLSHSHDDLNNGDLDKIIVLLRRTGVNVYIDSKDASLPPFTNANTAKKIKEQIKLNRKFILVATNRAIDSKWCNWELGFGDAHKYIEHIALIPLADNASTWNGSEYLKIYPRIEESSITPNSFNVYYPDGSIISLLNWLKQ